MPADENVTSQGTHAVEHATIRQRVDEIEKRLQTVEEEVHSLTVSEATIKERLDMLIETIHEWKRSFDKKFDEKFKEIESEIKEFRYRPARLWDGFILALISASVGGVLAILIQNTLRR